MKDSIITNKTLLNKFQNFFYSRYYPIFVALCTLFCYSTRISVLGLAFFVALSAITLLAFRDASPFYPVPMMILLSFSDFEFFSNTFSLILVGIFICCFVAKFFIYPIKNFKFGKLFIPICIASVGLLCGGLFSSYMKDYLRGLITCLSVGPLVLLLYVFFSNYHCPPKDLNFKEHLFFTFVVVSVLSSLTMFIHEYYYTLGLFLKYNMGHGNTNKSALALLMTIPFSWYFICKKKNVIPYAIVLLLSYVAIFLSKSVGVLALALAFIPVLLVLGYYKSDDYHRKLFANIIFIGIVCALFGLMLLATKINLYDLLLTVLSKFQSDNGRTTLYKRAVELFNKFPIFGVSFGYLDIADLPINTPATESVLIFTMSFHSTFFHLLATTGIFGLCTYIVYYVARFRVLMFKDTMFNVTAFLSFVLYTMYGMISTEEFEIIPILIYALILLVNVEKYNKEKDCNCSLPLRKKILSYK